MKPVVVELRARKEGIVIADVIADLCERNNVVITLDAWTDYDYCAEDEMGEVRFAETDTVGFLVLRSADLLDVEVRGDLIDAEKAIRPPPSPLTLSKILR